MKRIIAIAGIGLFGLGTLAACSDGVDREGSRDNFVETFEELGLKADEACLDDVLDDYDDDELKDFDKELNNEDEEPSAEAQAFATDILECASPAD
jgi:hypothetical protein